MAAKIQDGRHEIQFCDISTSDDGGFLRNIEIALFHIFFVYLMTLFNFRVSKIVKFDFFNHYCTTDRKLQMNTPYFYFRLIIFY